LLRSLLQIGWIVALTTGAAPPGPANQAPKLRDDAIIAADGVALDLRHWSRTELPRAVVLALHRFIDHWRSFVSLGEIFAGVGIAMYAFEEFGFELAPSWLAGSFWVEIHSAYYAEIAHDGSGIQSETVGQYRNFAPIRA